MKKKLVSFICLMIMAVSMMSSAMAVCNHHYEWETQREPTCTKAGLETEVCQKCGAKRRSRGIEKKPHKWYGNGSYRLVDTATCQHKDRWERVCKECGYEDYKYGKRVDHDFCIPLVHKKPTCSATGVRVKKCRWCGLKDEKNTESIPKDPNNHRLGASKKIGWDEEMNAYKYERKCLDCKTPVYDYRDK